MRKPEVPVELNTWDRDKFKEGLSYFKNAHPAGGRRVGSQAWQSLRGDEMPEVWVFTEKNPGQESKNRCRVCVRKALGSAPKGDQVPGLPLTSLQGRTSSGSQAQAPE